MNSLRKMWTYSHKHPILRLLTRDINKDGRDEIIATTQKGEIIILNPEGKILFKETIPNKTAIYSIKITDITENNELELIIGTMDGKLRVFSIKHKKKISLEPLWGHSFGANIIGFLIEDINQDSQLDLIVYSLDKSLRVLDGKDGELIWAQMFEEGIGDAIILEKEKPISHYQIAACGNDGTLRIFDGTDGSLEWFKKYPNKLRALNQFTIQNTHLLICGGDDKELYYIDRKTHEKVAQLTFSDYIWRIGSFSEINSSTLFINTYSFAFLYENTPNRHLKFTSQFFYLNSKQKTSWQVKGVNIEAVELLKRVDGAYISLASTNGQIMIIDEASGNIISKTKEESSINCISYISKDNLLLTGNDNGEINAYYFLD